MSHIDERIVKLTFDNQNFESKINQTLQSLEKLNNVLKNTGNAEAVNQLSKSMKDIKSQLSGLSLGELEKLTAKDSVWQKLGNTLTNAGKGISVIFSKIDLGGFVNKLGTAFSGAIGGSNKLGFSVDTVTKSFSALQVVGMTALANITNKAVNAGTTLLKSLTIDPVTTGFGEYETKVNAISTILANTADEGATLADVSKALNELNVYADDTIYNFAQMTENIGRFTAAGVGLEDSVAAIKGLANLAAFFGVDATKASGAMYQMSQALAAGRVQLMDWNSLVNAGMSGEAFQKALIRTSELMGTGAEAAIEKYGSFNHSLTKGEWLTGDVMIETLKQISGAYKESELRAQGYSATQAKAIVEMANRANQAATEVRTLTGMFDAMKESVQSGWAISWEHIIGDKEQATKLLTNVKDAFESVINPISDARNEMLLFWNQNGGRDAAINGLGNVFTSLGKILGGVRDGFRDIFPPMTGQKLVELSKGFEKFTEKLKVSDKTVGKIKDAFKGFFSVFDLAGSSFKSVMVGFAPLTNIFKGLGNAVLTIGSSIGNLLSKMSGSIKASGFFDSIGGGIERGLNAVNNAITNVADGISYVIDSISSLNFDPVLNFFKDIGGGLGQGVNKVLEGLGKALGTIDFRVLFAATSTLASKDAFGKIKSTFDSVAKSIKDLTGLPTKIATTLGSIRETLEAYQNSLNAGTLLKIGGAIALLAGSLILLASINPSTLDTGLAAMTVLFAELIAGLGVLMVVTSKYKTAFLSINGIAVALLSLGVSMILLATAMKIISTMDWQGLAKGLIGIAGGVGAMAAAVQLLSGKHKGLVKTAASMLILGSALIVMAGAVKLFSTMDLASLGTGLLGVAGVLGELIIFMKLLGDSKMSVTSSVGLLVLAGALSALQYAVAAFGKMDVGALLQGMAAMAGVLTVVGAFSKLATNGLNMLALAGGMLVMSGALFALSGAMKSFGEMQWNEIATGLTALAGALVIIGVAVKAISGINMAITGAGLLVMSNALIVMGNALKNMGGMSWEEIGRGLVALAGGLLVLGVAMAAMSGGLLGAAAMAVMAGALAIFVPQLVALANLSWTQVAIGLVALAGAFTVLGVAAAVLTPLIPSLALLGGAIALLGVGCLAAGAGVSMFATAMALLAGVGAGGIFAFTEAIRGLINLLPQLGKKLGELVVSLATVLGENMPQLSQAMGQMFVGAIDALRTAVPQFTALALELLAALCDALSQGIPLLLDAGIKMTLAVLDGIARNISQVVVKGTEVVLGFLDGVGKSMGPLIQAGIDLAIDFIEGLATGIETNASRFNAAVEHLIIACINAVTGLAVSIFLGLGNSSIGGLVSGILSKAGSVISSVGTIVSNAVNKARSAVSQFLSAGGQWISNLISGIKARVGGITSAIGSMVSSAVSKAKSGASQMISAGRSMIEGFISGIKEKAASVARAASDVVSKAISAAKSALKINSPSKVFIQIGAWTSEGMAIGIDKNARMVENASANMADTAINGVSNAIGQIANAINADMDMQPTITPVMDLSNIQNGSRMISSMLGSNPAMGLNANLTGSLSRSIGGIQNGSSNDDVVSALKDLQKSMAGNTGNTYNVNGITYDDGSNVRSAVETLVKAAKMERRM